MPLILTYGLGVSGGGGFEDNAVRFSDMKNATVVNKEMKAELSTSRVTASIETKSINAAVVTKRLTAEGVTPKLSATVKE